MIKHILSGFLWGIHHVKKAIHLKQKFPFILALSILSPTEWNYFIVNCSITCSKSMEDFKAPKKFYKFAQRGTAQSSELGFLTSTMKRPMVCTLKVACIWCGSFDLVQKMVLRVNAHCYNSPRKLSTIPLTHLEHSTCGDFYALSQYPTHERPITHEYIFHYTLSTIHDNNIWHVFQVTEMFCTFNMNCYIYGHRINIHMF